MSDTSKPRILLIDDERSITSTAPSILQDLCDVDVANTIAEALVALAAHSYGAVVLDLVLPDGDPTALHDALSSRGLPVVLVSGRDVEALVRIANARNWPYAAKPFAPSTLRSLVAEALGVDVEPTQRGVRPPPAPRPGGPPREVGESPSTPSKPISVQALDKLVDIVAILAVAYLGVAGKLGGELAGGIIAAIAGVGTIGRAVTGRQVGAASAAVALAAMLHASPASAHAAPLDRPRPQSTPPAATLLSLLVLVVLVLVLAVACGPARAALMSATPGVPPLTTGIDAGAQRCNGTVPEVCVASGDGVRCWPSLQRDARGHQRVCVAGCTVDDAGIAGCLPGDVGDLDDDASEVSQ